MRAYITDHLCAYMQCIQWFHCFRQSESWHLMLRHMPVFIFFSGFVKSSVVCDLTTLSFWDNPLQFERPVVRKKFVVCTLCACLQLLCSGGRLHCVLMLWWCAPRGGAGKERKQLLVAANRSMSDRNSLGAEKYRCLSTDTLWGFSLMQSCQENGIGGHKTGYEERKGGKDEWGCLTEDRRDRLN